VSAFAFGGIPARVVEDVVVRHDLLVSRTLLAEYRAVPADLLARGKITPAQWRALVVGIAAAVAVGRVVVPRKRLHLCRDPGDDRFLDVCLAGGADVLVTGDAGLLSVEAEELRAVGLGSLRILTPKAYLARARKRTYRKRT
jgi:putative PIN family toxin of toxin-antitoxin system